MSQGIDTAVERTPPSVAAMKIFKEKLLQGHKVVASQFGIELPSMTTQNNLAYIVDDIEEVDFTGEPEEDNDTNYQDSETIGAMEVTNPYTEKIKKDPVQMLSEYLEQTPAKSEIKIVSPFGKLGFKALNVSITEFGVAFIIKKDAIQFEPNINTELTIQYQGQDYSVIYAGGFFTFPKIPFTFVSFLRVQPE
jgi:hypothetical protein